MANVANGGHRVWTIFFSERNTGHAATYEHNTSHAVTYKHNLVYVANGSDHGGCPRMFSRAQHGSCCIEQRNMAGHNE